MDKFSRGKKLLELSIQKSQKSGNTHPGCTTTGLSVTGGKDIPESPVFSGGHDLSPDTHGSCQSVATLHMDSVVPWPGTEVTVHSQEAESLPCEALDLLPRPIAPKSYTAAELFEQMGHACDDLLDEEEDLSLDEDLLNESELFAKLDSLEKGAYHVPETDTESNDDMHVSDLDQSDSDPNYVPDTESDGETESDNEPLLANLPPNEAQHILADNDQPVERDLENQMENDQPPKKRSKKAQPENWKQNLNHSRRERGEQYVGSKKVGTARHETAKAGRSLKPRCKCQLSSSRQCAVFTEEDRKDIFTSVWKNMSWNERKLFVKGHVDAVPPKRRRTTADQSRRNITFKCHLKLNGVRKPVCRKMYMATTCIGRWSLQQWAKTSTTPTAEPVRSRYYDRALQAREFMRKEFFDKLPKMPSHYCRASSSKSYLEPTIPSISDLYKLYKEKCTEHGKVALSRQILIDEFDKMNLSLFRPRKDQCDICVGHEAGNITDEQWEEHRNKKDEARAEKTKDKEEVIQSQQATHDGQKTLVTCMDLQAVLLSPSLEASAMYYKQKLCVHNFTIYNLANHKTVCYVWHEAEGGLTASEFVTCIIHYLEENPEYDTYILYSDGCGYQNRNAVLSNALVRFAKQHQKTVIQKILEKGHTQMEVDSVHAKIEVKLKPKAKKPIYVPANYVDVIKAARMHQEPYKVEYVDHTFFKDYSQVGQLKSIRPGSRVGDPTVTDLRAIKYNPDGSVQYRLRHVDEWEVLPEPRRARANANPQNDDAPTPLFTEPRKIQESKWKNLQELKAVIHKDYHEFYDKLLHGNLLC